MGITNESDCLEILSSTVPFTDYNHAMYNCPMNPYPAREALLSCGVLALVACLLSGLFSVIAVVSLLWMF